MTMIRTAFAALAVLALSQVPALGQTATAPANVMGYQASDLSGRWEGVFYQGEAATGFTASLLNDGASVVGSIVEINGFGSADTPYLLSDVAGTVRNRQVSFLKTYNGVGGQTHTVRYVGRITADGRAISGTWSLEGASGRFVMAR